MTAPAKRLSKGMRNARDWVYRSIWRGSVLGYVGIGSRALTEREPWHADLDRPGIDAIQKLGQRHFPRAVRVPSYLLRAPGGRVTTVLPPWRDPLPEARVIRVEYSEGVFRWRTMSLADGRRAELEPS